MKRAINLVKATTLLAAVALVAVACGGLIEYRAPQAATTPGIKTPPVEPPESFTSVVAAVSVSIVLVETSTALGSGIVLDGSGDVVTNAHLVSGSKYVLVTSAAGKQYTGRLAGQYPDGDLAVIKVNTHDLQPADWGDSDRLRVGDIVLAVGNPLGFGSSVTQGIVSGRGRMVSGPNGVTLTDMLQTSAAINHGNSGGGLVNLQSQVVGMPTADVVDSEMGSAPGVGYALPSNRVVDYAHQILRYGRVLSSNRPSLGLQVGDVTGTGVVVLGVDEFGPAWDAGVQMGDVIVTLNGAPFGNATALAEKVADMKPDQVITLGVVRAGRKLSIGVTLGSLMGV